jgi:hypothetical protein
MAGTLDGVKVKLSGREFVIPPLSLRSLKSLGAKIKMVAIIDGVPTDEQTDAIVDIIFEAMKRNYPDIAKDELLDLVDLSNLMEVFPAVLAMSGLKQKAGPAALGEAVSPKN